MDLFLDSGVSAYRTGETFVTTFVIGISSFFFSLFFTLKTLKNYYNCVVMLLQSYYYYCMKDFRLFDELR